MRILYQIWDASFLCYTLVMIFRAERATRSMKDVLSLNVTAYDMGKLRGCKKKCERDVFVDAKPVSSSYIG